jgi:phosphoribosylaminoimidazole (AIR) synthetase
MNNNYLNAITIALATFVAGHAVAADESTAKTREQVKLEQAESVRTGDFVVGGETPRMANELFPSSYPAKAVVVGKTREAVQTELANAMRSGDFIVSGETPQKANVLSPSQYPAQAVAVSKTRDEVKAELFEAIRTGNMPVDNELSFVLNQKYNQLSNRSI